MELARIFILVTLIFWSAQGFSDDSPSSSSLSKVWLPKRELAGIEIYRLSNDDNIRATFKSYPGPSKLNKFKDKKELIKNFEKDKNKTLARFNMPQWRANRYEWDKDKSLTIFGTHKNPQGQTVQFIEHHIFKKDKRHIIVINAETKNKLDQSYLKSFIDELQTRQDFN